MIMGKAKLTEEFRPNTIKQIKERGRYVAEVLQCLGVSFHFAVNKSLCGDHVFESPKQHQLS